VIEASEVEARGRRLNRPTDRESNKGKAMRRSIALIVTAAALLPGCGGSNSATTTASPTAVSPSVSSASTSGAAPTAEQTAWAGGVCTAATTLQKDVEGLASAVTSGGGDVSAALTAQMATVKTSATALATAIAAVPAGSESDPEAAAVKASADQFKASVTDLEAKVVALEGASGMSKATALASIGSAASSSLSSLASTTQAIKTAATDSKSTLGQAFAGAPSCSSLTR